ncbi:efflux RND transporter periplasmic adaptor subunit [Prolixibacteraceae bacterium Z1-6]|uniref:Efflux RND transporter periplasmic adaptor subunit n=1 Tax=Draconibacterium aestuarii TaxID=2998507 RepID=A0A9X3J8D4_9BACT|nr:efflux RND transporter periplasmic adaptor subunit [Prolixibacteraceae bacterium Z1-6]
MKNIKLLILVAVVAAAFSCNNQQSSEATDLAVPVSVENVKLRSIQQFINTTGTAKARSETELFSEIAGDYKLQINPKTGRKFKLGDHVQAGQVIIKFEDEEYVNGISLESKKLNLEISEQEYEKQKSLYEKGGVTLRELRNSEVSKIDTKNSYEGAKIQIAKMQIVAPFSGVITDLPYYTEGVRISSGQSMVSLMSYDKMYVEINLPEKNISEVKVGQEVVITNYTLTEDTLTGHVTELSPVISTETRTFAGKLQIDNPELKLRPGMFVKADIITAQKDSTVVIPKDIILSGSRGKYVFVVGRNSAAEDRRITTGISNQDEIEVLEGLSANDRLIIKGFETLRDHSKVKVIL